MPIVAPLEKEFMDAEAEGKMLGITLSAEAKQAKETGYKVTIGPPLLRSRTDTRQGAGAGAGAEGRDGDPMRASELCPQEITTSGLTTRVRSHSGTSRAHFISSSVHHHPYYTL